VGGRTPGDYPKNLGEFMRRFPDEAACRRYLIATRWPDGFRCACGSSTAAFIEARGVWQCRACRHQTSITAGTVLHRSKLPLTAWFVAAYLVTSLKPGISAFQLGRQLGISYEAAWLLLHKLRRAMVNPDRSRLSGVVEVDETWVGGRQTDLKGGRQLAGRKALLVGVAVERRLKIVPPGAPPPRNPTYLGRLRLEVIPDSTAQTLHAFIARNVEPGSIIASDAWRGYRSLPPAYTHRPISQAALKSAGLAPDAVPGVHRVISNLKTWLRGTHHGVGADHLDHYLNEYVFRFNRRFYPMAGFATLLGLGTVLPPTPASEILASPQPATAARTPGRSTGLTGTRFSIEINQAPTLEAATRAIEALLDDSARSAGPE
jgi:ribosomal protein L37AE/L43A